MICGTSNHFAAIPDDWFIARSAPSHWLHPWVRERENSIAFGNAISTVLSSSLALCVVRTPIALLASCVIVPPVRRWCHGTFTDDGRVTIFYEGGVAIERPAPARVLSNRADSCAQLCACPGIFSFFIVSAL